MIRRAAGVALVLLAALCGCGGSGDEAGGRFGAFFGISPVDVPSAPDYSRMSNGGIGSYRLPLAWSTVEATKGTYNWAPFDATLAELAKNGIEPIVNVTGTPAGYAPKLTDPPTSSGEAFDAWADFLHAAALRYGPDGTFWGAFAEANPGIAPQPLRVWEIWNEPNTSTFWTPSPDPGAYSALLKRSSRVLKNVDPDAQIMVGGMFVTPPSDGAIVSFDFLRDIYDHRGVADTVDLVGVHPYGPDVESVTKQLDGTRDAIDAAGDDAGLWVTELGWGSDPNVPNQLAETPEKQAELLTDSFKVMYDDRDQWDLKGVVWFTWRDSSVLVGTCLWCQTAGLIDPDGDSKPSWLAFTDLSGGTP